MAAPATSHFSSKKYLRQPEFLQKFTLPATEHRDALETAYSDLGAQPAPGQDTPPTLLFMPGLLASRLTGVTLGVVGKKLGVRIIVVDRFGIGQSANVPLEQRISTWVELVPKLLAHLGISSVSLMSHSAGTIYLLNLLHECRDILSPSRPYAVILGPWVDVKHSRVRSMQTAQLLPNFVLGKFDTVIKSMNTYVGPVIGSSLSLMDKWFTSNGAAPSAEEAARRAHVQAEYGISLDFLDTVNETAVRIATNEDISGLNDETKILLKKAGNWGACEDYGECVKELARRESLRRPDERLHIKLFFAEEDSMIGQRGQEYMETCWKALDDGEYKGVIDVEMKTVLDTNHDCLAGRLPILKEAMTFMK